MMAPVQLESRSVDHESMEAIANEGALFAERSRRAAAQIEQINAQMAALKTRLTQARTEYAYTDSRARSHDEIVSKICEGNGWEKPAVSRPPLRETSAWPVTPTETGAFPAVRDDGLGVRSSEPIPVIEGTIGIFVGKDAEERRAVLAEAVTPEPVDDDERDRRNPDEKIAEKFDEFEGSEFWAEAPEVHELGKDPRRSAVEESGKDDDPPDEPPAGAVPEGKPGPLRSIADMARRATGGAFSALVIAWALLAYARPLLAAQRPLWRRVARSLIPPHTGTRVAKAVRTT